MEAEEEVSSPFWLKSTTNRHRRLHRTSSLLLNSGFFLIFILCIVFILVFMIVPTLLNFTSQIFRTSSVKKSWDSLNIVLVLFAIICGFLRGSGGNNNDNLSSSYEDCDFATNLSSDVRKSPNSRPHWYEEENQIDYNNKSLHRLKSSSSYPDLRQESSWLINTDQRWRFYDDTRVNDYRSTPHQLHNHRAERGIQGEYEEEPQKLGSIESKIKSSLVQEEELKLPQAPPLPPPPLPPPQLPVQSRSPPRLPSPPPSPPPRPPQPKVVKRKMKRAYSYDDLPLEEKDNYELPPLSPPLPPPSLPEYYTKNEKKRGGAKGLILASLRKKKKKQRQKSVENLNFLFDPEPEPEPTSASSSFFPPPPPPPPLPPPPAVFFKNMFSSKKSKTKTRVLSVSPQSPPNPPIPPPRPPPPRPLEARASKSKPQKTPITVQKHPSPTKTISYTYIGNQSPLHIPTTPPPPARELRAYKSKPQKTPITVQKPPSPTKTMSYTYIGNQSTFHIPIPPPPPPPPFKMPAWKFVVQGDYVRIKSNNSSPRSQSPDLDFGDDSEQPTTPSDGGGESPMTLSVGSTFFCPSPDVNTKADNFIAKFRAGLKLEKNNLVTGRSNLGPSPSQILKPV